MSARISILIFILLFVLGVRFLLLPHNESNQIEGDFISFQAKISSEPKIFGKSQTFYVNLDHNNSLFIKTSSNADFSNGDLIVVSGRVEKRMPEGKKPVFAMNFPKIQASQAKGSLGTTIINKTRGKIEDVFQKSLSQTYSSLLIGITFGLREDLPVELRNNLKQTGVFHVIAASGMNVTILVSFLISLFNLFFKRQWAIVLSIFGIIFYAAISGFQPSIVRASIMGVAAFSAQMFGRQNLAYLSLFFAGYAMLLFSPDLITDIGFQLSFSSTLGLLLIKPVFEFARIKNLVQKSILGEDVTTTISAQAASMPILLSNFGAYSLFSVIANGLVLWTIPILMVIGGLGFLISFIFEPLARLILYLSIPFLFYFELIVGLFSKLPQFSLNSFPLISAVGYYLILASVVLFLKRRAKCSLKSEIRSTKSETISKHK